MKMFHHNKLISMILLISLSFTSFSSKKAQADFITIGTFVLTGVLTGGSALWGVARIIGKHSRQNWDRHYCFERGMGLRNFFCLSCCCLPRTWIKPWADTEPPAHDPYTSHASSFTSDLPEDNINKKAPQTLGMSKASSKENEPSVGDFFKILQEKDGEKVIQFGTQSEKQLTQAEFLEVFKKVAQKNGFSIKEEDLEIFPDIKNRSLEKPDSDTEED